MAAMALNLGDTLRSQLERRPASTWVALSGTINEATDLGPLASVAGPLVIDLAELHRINSVGVRIWMDFVRGREKAGVELVFERCSPIMVGQMSMITHFMGTRSRVKSVHVPYLCSACNHEQLQVLEVSPGIQVTAAIACPRCSSRMNLDELPETYDEALRRL
jgi:DNA-directed RNA polymerase subunit RPC12/RpoP